MSDGGRSIAGVLIDEERYPLLLDWVGRLPAGEAWTSERVALELLLGNLVGNTGDPGFAEELSAYQQALRAEVERLPGALDELPAAAYSHVSAEAFGSAVAAARIALRVSLEEIADQAHEQALRDADGLRRGASMAASPDMREEFRARELAKRDEARRWAELAAGTGPGPVE